MACNKVFSLQRQLESLIVGDISISAGAEEKVGAFLPGESINQRTLRISITTDVPFPIGARLHVRLVASINADGVKTAIAPHIYTIYTIESISLLHLIDLVGAQIPLPKGVIYLANDQATCPPQLWAGAVEKYVLQLATSRFVCGAISKPALSIVAHVKSGAQCDLKCEKPSTSSEPSPDFPVKIYCQDSQSFVYASAPHCVTHCRAPRPVVQYYDYSEEKSVSVPIAPSCTSCYPK